MSRTVLLIACIALGCTVGYVGWLMSGSQWWYLAIPGAIAAVWLMVANPERCLSRDGQSTADGDSAA